ncbi:MAG: DNA-binding response regulator [Betaproteobacteria bacterium HGW-Betaproteobacteria-12]|nr:MAG: DNA-binding response regulator [Betaproteobacteria bacterium HGW-Betaproteobacteria-12]
MKILLVEDHPELCEWVAKALRQAGYAVDTADRGDHAEHFLLTGEYDGVLLDLSLPGKDGLEVLRDLRGRGSRVPVLIFTARGSVEERIKGLDLGADDYLAKPFVLAELEARLKALLRRSAGQTPVVRLGELAFDTVSRQPSVRGQPLALTTRELAVLEALLGRIGRPLARDALFEKVFSLEQDVRPEAIEIYVCRLRKKLDGSGVRIDTVRGLGYVIDAVGESPP